MLANAVGECPVVAQAKERCSWLICEKTIIILTKLWKKCEVVVVGMTAV